MYYFGHFDPKMAGKRNKLDCEGEGGGAHVRSAPLDPPMHRDTFEFSLNDFQK